MATSSCVGKLKRPVYWVSLAVAFGCAATGTALAAFRNIDLGYAYVVLAVAALACGFTAIRLLVKTKNLLRLSGIAQLLVLVIAGAYLNAFLVVQLDYYRSRRAVEANMLESLRHIRVAIDKYARRTGQLPSADSWCDALVSYVGGDTAFRLGAIPDVPCLFAFNRNVGNLALNQVPSNAVVVIEADGAWNGSGGPELLSGRHAKFEYNVLAWPRFVHILFGDGTIGRYRLRDGAVARYCGPAEEFGASAHKRASSAFGPFLPQGETQYSPLRWEKGSSI